jgi:hypothetical protein
MSCDKKNDSAAGSVVRLFNVLPLIIVMLLASPAALAVDSGDIVVVSLKGDVRFTVSGATRRLRAGAVLEPPATLQTGRDGSVDLRQGATTVSVGPDTLLEFPALETRGAPVDRILQPRGNVFYDIGKREGRKLRIETPYLVGVVKGTQFNVAAQDGATTISLFEGLLEVRATDESDVVDLTAGNIATRKRGDLSIGILKMDGKTPAGPRPPSGSGSNTPAPSPAAPRATPSETGGRSRFVDVDVSPIAPVAVSPGTETGTGAVGVLAGPADAAPSGVDTSANTRVDVVPVAVETVTTVSVAPPGVDLSTTTSVDAGPVAVDAGPVAVDAGPVAVDTSAAVTTGSSVVDVTTSTSVDAGPVSVDTGTAVSVGAPGVDLTTTTAVDAGPIAVDVGTTTATDLGAGTVDAGATVAVDAGPLTTDAGTTTAVDLGAGTVDAGLTVGASAPGVAVDVGTSVAADTTAGTVNLGLEVAGADLGLEVDLGLDDDVDNSGPGNQNDTSDSSGPGSSPADDTATVDVGGLLDGLLRRPGRR